MCSFVAHRRKQTPFVILKTKNILKEKHPSGIIFQCNEKRWLTEELVFEWWVREV
jgi:hypothetical protein